MNDSKTEQKIPLILASNGKTGSRVAERFRASSLGFREGSRNSDIPFDWYDSGTWQQALDGRGRACTLTDDTAGSRALAVVRLVSRLCRMAR